MSIFYANNKVPLLLKFHMRRNEKWNKVAPENEECYPVCLPPGLGLIWIGDSKDQVGLS